MAKIKGSYVLKDGKIKKATRRLDTSAQIRQRKSKKVKVVRPGTKP